ncbi:MAG: 50S ribosomal protein L4 [Deltaproteobacteria bacterium]|nr:50S ribosomal protein L4 [Deltaproteobacteria bacterium]MBW1930906.1 50S ribosomal protein L4 [Deltaproteobacteria bacterium]MBW2024865.1 50S ribosomal protein L4 [Deltaproteobacteria bacterium]MBW2125463.1 50S ribosomal protein L4 [Deltaproteobacteria bacterium]RLB22121.1 MAG: 50S ribosomal protein L4 [Deltaproteobacteria bacterium]
MTTVDVYNLQKEKVGEIELREEVFNVPIKKHVLHQVVVSQLAQKRSGSASTKSRSQVKASGRKLWRQKGTGRARVGSAASPTRRGGGVAFGPSPRDYVVKVPKKVRKAALRMALTDKVQNDQLIVVDDFRLPEIKTKSFVEVMKRFQVKGALIVTETLDENLDKSSRNVPWVKVMRREGINVYDILKYKNLFLERPALEKIEEVLA